MIPTHHVPPALVQLALAQEGIITGEQCARLGLSRDVVHRLCREGHWRRVAHALFTIVPGELSRPAQRWAAVLAGGDGAALGLEAAAELWELQPESRTPPVVIVPDQRPRSTSGPWRFLRTRVPFTTRGTPPRTTVERTVLDLCRQDPDEVVSLLTTAVNSRRTTPARLLRELENFSRFPRRDVVRGVLGDTAQGALSYLEVKYLRTVERAHGLPRGTRQTGSRAGFRDMHRDNVHLLQGEHTLRFGQFDVDRRPCEVAAMVVQALHLLGQPADPHPCGPRCLLALEHLGHIA